MRAFLALEMPSEIAGYLGTVIDRLAKRSEGVKWVRNEGIHITVKFLGEIGDDFALAMRQVVVPLGSRYAAVKTRLGQLDAFPSRRSGRIIVVKLLQGIEDMQSIFLDVEEGLEGLNVEREKRDWVPHITLGRRRVPKAFPDGDLLPVEEKVFVVENLVLYKSTLTPGGAIYAPIWKVKLGGENR
jgi:RNA 2',3'-cyclic 3'-phosphodiesterase